jgi:HTH-like domain
MPDRSGARAGIDNCAGGAIDLCWSSEMKFRFIEDRRTDYPMTILCEVLEVSPAGYYAWRSRPESLRSAANRELVDDIKQIHRDTRGRYGSPRIHEELKAQGRGASRGRIERLMRHSDPARLWPTSQRSSGFSGEIELAYALEVSRRT